MKVATRVLALASSLAILAGCAQSISGSGPLPNRAPASQDERRTSVAHAVFRIKVPHSEARRGLRARFVSPATKSVTIALNGPTAYDQTIAVTAGSPNCVTNLGGTSCTFQIALQPGDYSGSVTAYDAVVPASGHPLSAATNIAFTIAAGTINTVRMTLSGIPEQIVMTPGSRASVSNVSGGIDLLGVGARPIVVEAFDADHNAIVGPGAPSFTVAQTGGSLNVAIAQPSASAPNTFTVSPPSALSTSTATLTATASFTAPATNGCGGTAVCTGSVTVDMRELIAVQGYNAVVVFEQGQAAPLATVNGGVTNPSAITFDSVGDLVVADCLVGCGNGGSTDTVAVYAPPFTGVPVMITAGIVGPSALAVDASGDLFVADCGSCSNLGLSDEVTEYKPPFTAASAPVATITNSVFRPIGLALDATGNMWVAMQGSNIRRYVPPYTAFPSTTVAYNGFGGMALDASANLYVANQNANTLTAYKPPYTSTSATVGSGVHFPVGVGADPSGDVFVANFTGNTVSEFKSPLTDLSTAATSISSGISGPTALAIDALGNLYVANGNSGKISTYTSPYSAGAVTLNPGMTPQQLAILP